MTRAQVVDALVANNISAYDAGYTHARSASWKIVSDGSVQNGFEVVSPVLEGEDGIAMVRFVASLIELVGGTVNQSCGLHVHVDAAGLSVSDVKTIIRRYAFHEEAIDAVMPPSRRNNASAYCRSVKDSVASAVVRSTASNLSTLAMAQMGRYFKVNLQALRVHGTIEFRQHSGTTDATKIENWVRFLLAFVDRSVEISTQMPVEISTITVTNPRPDVAAPIGRQPRIGSLRYRVLQLALQGKTAREIATELRLPNNDVNHRMMVIIRDYQLPLVAIGHGSWTSWTRPTVQQAPETVISVNEVTPAVVVEDASPFDGCDEAVRTFYASRAAKFANH